MCMYVSMYMYMYIYLFYHHRPKKAMMEDFSCDVVLLKASFIPDITGLQEKILFLYPQL